LALLASAARERRCGVRCALDWHWEQLGTLDADEGARRFVLEDGKGVRKAEMDMRQPERGFMK